MLARRHAAPIIDAVPDRFRGTIQRWSVETGPLAGTVCDLAFNEDWSLTWRVIAGLAQGDAGRARRFDVQPVRVQLFIVSFPIAGEVLTVTVDFASRRFVGFRTGAADCLPVEGSIRVL
ncbi:MAG TPA: hypothetical protein VMN56_00940 [Casimicrobiaceae bacterium]|nr:hypothetical protein [Casimicrobiaceae bacterium]